MDDIALVISLLIIERVTLYIVSPIPVLEMKMTQLTTAVSYSTQAIIAAVHARGWLAYLAEMNDLALVQAIAVLYSGLSE